MKFNKLFISVGICCAAMIGCNQPQKQVATTNDDVIWKASLSYCLTNDKPDWSMLKDYGSELDYCDMYNFKINEEKGKYRDLIKLFYDSAISKTYPIYEVDPANGLFPMHLTTLQEKQSLFSDTAWTPVTGKYTLISDFFQLIKGLNINHEWLYDAKAGTLLSTVTDADLMMQYSGNDEYLVNMAALKFSNRTIDSMRTDQPGLKPEITWGREILMAVIDSGNGIKLNIPERWIKKDSLSRFIVNSVSSTSEPKYPICIKTTFNKSFAEWLVIAARSGQLQTYKFIDGGKIGDLLSTNELKDMNTIVDTFPNEHGIRKGYPHRLASDDITGVELKEEIAFHKSTFTFESKITYAGILVQSKDKTTGKAIHHTSTVLYWVKLN